MGLAAVDRGGHRVGVLGLIHDDEVIARDFGVAELPELQIVVVGKAGCPTIRVAHALPGPASIGQQMRRQIVLHLLRHIRDLGHMAGQDVIVC